MAKAYIERDGFRHDVDCRFAQLSDDEEWIAAGLPFCTCGPGRYKGIGVEHDKQ